MMLGAGTVNGADSTPAVPRPASSAWISAGVENAEKHGAREIRQALSVAIYRPM
jgi:hypothetical protein